MASSANEVARGPLVSIVVPHRDQPEWLRKCLQCCLTQTYPNVEVLVVDDASAVDPSSLVASFGDRAKIIRLPRQAGPGGARNVGVKAASGSVVQFLDCDDYISKDKLAVQVALMIARDVPVVLSDWRRAECPFGLELPLPVRRLPPTADLLQETIADGNWFPVMCGIFQKSFLELVGPWREDLVWAEDRDYRYRILKRNPAIARTSDCFFVYRRHVVPSRATTPQLGAKGLMNTFRFDFAFLDGILDEVAAGTVASEPALRGCLQRVTEIRRAAVHCKPEEAVEVDETIAKIEARMRGLGFTDRYGTFPIAQPLVERTRAARGIVRYVKPFVSPRLWLLAGLLRASLTGWARAWINHWKTRVAS